MVTNDEGFVYVKYYKQAQVLTRGTPTRTDYVFVIKANLSIAPVNPGDVDNITSRMIKNRECCPGGRKNGPAYTVATEDEVNKWLAG